MTDSEGIIQGESRFIVQTYSRPEIVFVRGDGVHLYDQDGQGYLDMGAGIAVNALGYGDAAWIEAVSEQAAKLTHISNLYHSQPHVELARRLVEHSFADRVFFCNSGSEANEAALKFARRWARAHHGEGKHGLVAFHGGFHGRTVGALSLTAREKYQRPFEPLMPGVTFAPFNDLATVAKTVDDRTCAVFVEPIQGEGGVIPAEADFLRGLRQLCDQHNALLVFDEVQCGLGRSGRLWAHENYGVLPDLMTLAKPLAGGLPIGATLVTEEIAQCIQVGDHGSTFAAGPLACRAAQVVFDRVREPAFLRRVQQRGEQLKRQLHELPSDRIREIRGSGLLWGIEFDRPVKQLLEACLAEGLIILNAGDQVVRLCPPLIITEDEIDEGLKILSQCVHRLEEGEDA